MKKLLFLLLFIFCFLVNNAQKHIGTPLDTIGMPSHNQAVGMGLQIGDTLVAIGDMIIGTLNGNKVTLLTNDTPRVTVLVNGNVGINEMIPLSTLHLVTTSGIRMDRAAGSDNAKIFIGSGGGYTSDELYFLMREAGYHFNTNDGAAADEAFTIAGHNVNNRITASSNGTNSIYYNQWHFASETGYNYGDDAGIYAINTATSLVKNANAYGVVGISKAVGADTTKNIGGYFDAENAIYNYALITNNGNVGIQTPSPTHLLTVGDSTIGNNGDMAYYDGNQSNTGWVLTNIGNGVARWAAGGGGGSAWLLNGNSGTDPSTNFIGTTDSPFVYFKVANIPFGMLRSDSNIIAFGQNYLSYGYGSQIVAIGNNIIPFSVIYEGNFIGDNAGTSSNLCSYINAIGNYAGSNIAFITPVSNINALGNHAAYSDIGSYVNAIGDSTAMLNMGSYVNAIGALAAYNNIGSYVNAQGYMAAYNSLSKNLNAFGTFSAGYSNATNVNAFGDSAGVGSALNNNLNQLGYYANYDNDGNNVNALGDSAAVYNGNYVSFPEQGSNVNALGYQAAYNNQGMNINANGYQAAFQNGDTIPHSYLGINVNANGYQAAYNNQGSNVNANGYMAAYNNAFNNVGAEGYMATPTDSNQFMFSNEYHHIVIPNGDIKIVDGNQGAGKVLTSDANGLASWQTASDWLLTGNAGIDPAINFVGTTDQQPLILRANNALVASFEDTLITIGDTLSGTAIKSHLQIGTSSFPNNATIKGSLLAQTNTITGDYGVSGVADLSQFGLSREGSMSAHIDSFGNTAVTLTDNLSGVPTILQQSYWTGQLATGTQIFMQPSYWNLIRNNTSAMFVDTFGNVGISTTQPFAKLDVNGDINLIKTLKFSGHNGNDSVYITTDSTSIQANQGTDIFIKGGKAFGNDGGSINLIGGEVGDTSGSHYGRGGSIDMIGGDSYEDFQSGGAITLRGGNGYYEQHGCSGGDINLYAGNSIYRGNGGNIYLQSGIDSLGSYGYVYIPNGLTINDGTQGSGKVLTSDVNGLASWQYANRDSIIILSTFRDTLLNGYTGVIFALCTAAADTLVLNANPYEGQRILIEAYDGNMASFTIEGNGSNVDAQAIVNANAAMVSGKQYILRYINGTWY